MKLIITLVVLVLMGIIGANYIGGEKEGFVLQWEEHFNGNEIDPTKWTLITGDGCPDHCGFGNNELQYYTNLSNNVRQNDGYLIIEARRLERGSRKYTSGKLVTRKKVDWKYGKVEIRAKLPQGRGTWPAFWMLPTITDRSYKWPEDGEIDIMEHVGYNQGMIYGTIHSGKYNHQIGTQLSDSVFVKDAHQEFHTYGIEWSPEQISWFVDGDVYQTLYKNDDDYNGWPFDASEFHLIINLAVGGDWGGKMGIDETIWPQQLIIDYIRYYRLDQ